MRRVLLSPLLRTVVCSIGIAGAITTTAIALPEPASAGGDVHERLAGAEPQYDPLFDDDAFEQELAGEPVGFPDPLEGMNRVVLGINRKIDRFLLDPLTRLYDVLVPEPVEPVVRRTFQHYGSASVLLNDILQLRLRDAATTAGRFAVNTAVGLGGLFDYARCWGWKRHTADFGQTLAHYGVGSGPYLILPLFGPSTARDAFGDLVDGLLHPARYILGPAQQLTYGSGAGLATRERHYQALNELEASAVDFYAALRNAYYQARMAEIRERTDRDLVVPVREESNGPCARTLDGLPERRIGPPPARGLAGDPVSRWSPWRGR